MQFSIQGQGSNTQTERGCDVRGISVGIVDTNAVASTQITRARMQSTLINVTLQRAGNNYTLMSGNLWALGISSLPTTYEGVPIYLTGTSNFVGFILDFGEIVNLQGDDVLSVQVTSGLNSTSTLTVDTIRGVGIGTYIPRVVQFSVDQNMSLQTHNLGDYVDTIALISDQGTGELDVTSVNITSNGRYSQVLTAPGLQSIAASQWERPWMAATNGEGYAAHLYQGPNIDGVICVTNNQVATGNTWLVAYAGVPDPTTLQRAENIAARVVAEDQQKRSSIQAGQK